MRAKIILDGWKPKVSYADVTTAIREAGAIVTNRSPDIGVVVGGDGVFSRVGSIESIPLLFVGTRSQSATGSKAYLAAVQFDQLTDALRQIESGRYRVEESRRLEVLKNGRKIGAVFTDVYMQRGADSNCIRYRVKVTGKDFGIEEAAIGDGVVVSTAAGSTGYYSYLDRIREGEFDQTGHTEFKSDQVGICHVLPTYMERTGSEGHPVRYTVTWGSRVELSITRPADARLYGLGGTRLGVRISASDMVAIMPSPETTKVIALT